MKPSAQRMLLHGGMTAALTLPVLLAAAKTIELLLFYDASTGMLDPSGGMPLVLGIGTVLVLISGVLTASLLRRSGTFCTSGQPITTGVGIFLSGVCFLGQTACDLLSVLGDSTLIIGGPKADITYLQIAVSVFSLLTGGVMIAIAYRMIATGKRPYPVLALVPTLWCILFMMNLLYSYENLVSMQDNAEKTAAGVLALLFCYYFGRELGSGGDKPSLVELLSRTLFPGIGFLLTVPYCVAWVCGVRDRASNMPYLALAGLAVLAGISLVQNCTGVLAGFYRQEKAPEIPREESEEQMQE